MYVVNARDSDMRTFHPIVQKYLIGRGIPVYKIIKENSHFRKTKRLEKELQDAPLRIRIFVRKG